jgi:sugar/nucleoside kinase (ribokinase family)
MKGMFSDGGEELIEIFKKVKAAGVTTSIDMALPDLNSEAGQFHWEPLLEKLLPYVDITVPSIEEMFLMLERDRYLEYIKELGGRDFLESLDIDLVSSIGHKLLDMGVSIVGLKCGEYGIFGFTGDEASIRELGTAAPADPANWSNRELYAESYHVDDVLSSTGAGDNSFGGFLAALLRGLSFEDALNIACMAGANATRAYSAVGGAVTLEKMQEQIAHPPQRNRFGGSTCYWTKLDSEGLWKGKRESRL